MKLKCEFPADCVYRENGLCDDPDVNSGNSDAACEQYSPLSPVFRHLYITEVPSVSQ